MIIDNVFSRSREICPNLPDGVHKIALHIARRTEARVSPSPQELAMLFTAVLEEEKIDGFELFPQLVDELMEDTYATKFRKICQEVIGINPPIIITPQEYSENIRIAVNWWKKAILFRDTFNMPLLFKKYLQRTYTTEEITIFKSTLAKQIAKELDKNKEVWLNSKWTTEGLLKEAGDKIGVNPLIGYPDASMVVYANEVKVCVDGRHWETIFCNN